MKTLGDLQLGIQGEQQRQAAGAGRVDVFLAARLLPGPAQAVVAPALGILAQGRRRGVVQELAEGLVAERLVLPGMEDELMPQVVHHLGGHRHIALAALEVGQEELAQPLRHQLAVLEGQLGMPGPQGREQAGRQAEVADEGFAAQRRQGFLPAPEQQGQGQGRHCGKDEQHARSPAQKCRDSGAKPRFVQVAQR
ncbi:hypothetical protein C1889_00715 [Pseudomonas sp. FW507-12TSA]|nr:hypothetical protein C1889_00715 [Pseudomonas sp. FW507-12TSA]